MTRRLWRHAAVLPLIVALAPAIAHATTILIVRTDVSVYVGMDSLRTVDGGRRPGVQVCKLRRLDGGHVVASGVVSHPPTGFVLDDLIAKASKAAAGVVAKAEAFEQVASPAIEEVAARLRMDDSGRFSQRYMDSTIVTVVFFAVEQGAPVVASRDFRPFLDEHGALRVKTHRCPGDDCPAGANVFALGAKSTLLQMLRENPDFLLAHETLPAIVDLISLQMPVTPEMVGPPINVFRVATTGSRWLLPSNVCRN